MILQEKRLGVYFENMAQKAGLSPQELAQGILDVADTAMERAIRVISVERGYDPREFTLFSFGGAGGMHAAFLARLLNIPKILLPSNPGILSALGMLMADVIKDYSLTIMKTQKTVTAMLLSQRFEEVEHKAHKDLRAEGIPDSKIDFERYLDMRYHGQSYEIMVPFDQDYVERFHALHEKTYGYINPDKAVEIVNIRLRARGGPEKPRLQKQKLIGKAPPSEALLGEKLVIFDHRRIYTNIFARDKLNSGNRIHGPAILVEYSSTIVIPPFAHAVVDEYSNIVMEII
jgi:N-methylhydantoinase A